MEQTTPTRITLPLSALDAVVEAALEVSAVLAVPPCALEETLRLSTAAGAASVMCTGTQAASLETIQQLMEQVTYREL